MKIKKEILKVLSMSFLLSSLAVTSPVVTTVTHAAGPHGGNGIDDKRDEEEKKKREEEEKRNREEAKKKENEERMKEIAQRVVQIEVKDEGEARKEVTEKLLKDLPPEFLEMYDKIGGKIRVVDGSLAEQPGLKAQKVVDDTGKEVSLDKYYAYVLEGREPVLFIRASEDYEESIQKRTTVYTEIGKSLIRDVLRPEVLLDPSFLKAVNQMRLDKDMQAEFFTPNLNGYKGSFNETYVKERIKDFQNIFAKAFAYFRVPEFKEFLKTYAPDMYDYFDKMDWEQLEGKLKNESLDFGDNVPQAMEWVNEQHYEDFNKSLTPEQRNAMNLYLGRNYQVINPYLWDTDPTKQINPELEKRIKYLQQALASKPLSEDIVVYRRMGATEYGLVVNDPAYNFNKPEYVKAFKEQWEGERKPRVFEYNNCK